MIKKYTVFVKRDHGLGGKHGRSKKKFGKGSKTEKDASYYLVDSRTWKTFRRSLHGLDYDFPSCVFFFQEPTTQLILGYKSSFKLFASQTEETQSQPSSAIPFKYCYELRSVSYKSADFRNAFDESTMEGGDKYSVKNPFVFVPLEFVIIMITLDGGTVFCLGIDKSEDVNIIGQNFMMGYRVVYDREKNILGWKASNCE
ncbi:putative aspartic peptidase A1 family, aspartic peptidase domain superfamily, xylanase inhibitor [Helianthus anomalus]